MKSLCSCSPATKLRPNFPAPRMNPFGILTIFSVWVEAVWIAWLWLESLIAISAGYSPPCWMWICGGLFGVAAHFLNVIKDMEQDQASGINGLPQRCGKLISVIIAKTLILFALIILYFSEISIP